MLRENLRRKPFQDMRQRIDLPRKEQRDPPVTELSECLPRALRAEQGYRLPSLLIPTEKETCTAPQGPRPPPKSRVQFSPDPCTILVTVLCVANVCCVLHNSTHSKFPLVFLLATRSRIFRKSYKREAYSHQQRQRIVQRPESTHRRDAQWEI